MAEADDPEEEGPVPADAAPDPAHHADAADPAAPGTTAAPARRDGRRTRGAHPVVAEGVAELLAAAGGPGSRAGLAVLDLGGGTGGLAVGLAEAGHDVVVVDPSPDALAALARRADEVGVAGRLTGVQGDTDDLAEHVADASVDLLLCHGVLEVVDDPEQALRACRRALRPTGRLSVLVAGRGGAVLGRVASGHLPQARALQQDRDGRWGPQDPLQRRFDADGARDLLARVGFSVLRTEGVGVLAPLAPRHGPDLDPSAARVLAALEQDASRDPALLGVAAALHLHAAPV